MNDEQRMIRAWRNAADELGVRVTAPFVLGGVQYPVHIANFGRASGTLPLLDGDSERERAAIAAGYFSSLLNPERYCEYDRDLFVATLNDWQWCGEPDSAPPWYTGEPWT